MAYHGGLWRTCPPTSSQDQFSDSSNIDEEMLGLGGGTSSKVLSWAWQVNYVTILGHGPPKSPQSVMAGAALGAE